MTFYEGEGTQFRYSKDDTNRLLLAKDKSGECFEVWSRFKQKIDLKRKLDPEKLAKSKKKIAKLRAKLKDHIDKFNKSGLKNIYSSK